MASGRSARLPPTPTSNIRHTSDVTGNNTSSYPANIPGETINALGPELAVATTQVLDTLSEKERQMILEVLNRDEDIRKREATRIMLLRAELQNLRRKGAIKADGGGSFDRPYIESNRYCARCSTELGRIINRGAPCRICRLRVCKTCREFTKRTTDWICVICHKQMELQATSGEWFTEYAKERPRRNSTSREYTSTADVLRKSIRRSWTISNPEDDNNPVNRHYPSIKSKLSNEISTGSYPSLVRHYNPHKSQNMDYDDNIEVHPMQRRVLRQSTLPSTLPNPDVANYYQNNKNLTAPTSPKLGQLSPQYSAYSAEDVPKCEIQPPPAFSQQQQPRFNMRRQSTLPCRPTDQQHGQIMYPSTSPNRPYSRSPERSEMEQRYPPFIRQSTFPSNSNETFSAHKPKILPTSPSRYNQFSDEPDEFVNKPRIVRQATLPNPDQHMKLLPTSPPKRQTSPQYMKRSPEFVRQNTMPNPDSFNSLTVHQQNAKFLPISPRQKQNFLFPNPIQNPRQFLSQQNVPTVAESEQYSSSQSINIHSREHSKMIKVRSHSNEEYTVTRSYPSENRRILPEIPLNRSPRSLSKLVRQDNVKEDIINRTNSISEQHRAVIRRVAYPEAKHNIQMEHDDGQQAYSDYYADNTFLESDETQYDSYNVNYSSEPKIVYEDTNEAVDVTIKNPIVRSADNFLNDPPADYPISEESSRGPRRDYRQRRRKSRELPDTEFKRQTTVPAAPPPSEDDHKRKPEAMRSVSEDSGVKPAIKPVTRRSLSHPEKESQGVKRPEVTKIPSPRPLVDISEKCRKPSKLPSPKRRGSKDTEHQLELSTNEGPTTTLLSKPSSSPSKQDSDISPNKIAGDNNLLQEKKDSNQNQKSDDNKTKEIHTISEDNQQKNDKVDDKIATDASGSASGSDQKLNNNDKDAMAEEITTNDDDAQSKEHKSTLGEAEIQSAVEAAAVIFKKVVLQRRREKKVAEEGELSSMSRGRTYTTTHSSIINQDDTLSDYEPAASGLKVFCPETDEYKLVFISSDSSSKEEEFEDSSSTTSSTNNRNSLTLDDCDWDYFEPGAGLTKNILKSPYDSPIVRRRENFSPIDSPILYRRALSESSSSSIFRYRMRESDTGTDEEMLMRAESSSPTSSDGFLNNNYDICTRNRMKTKILRHHNSTKSHLRNYNVNDMKPTTTTTPTCNANNSQTKDSRSGSSGCSCGGILQPQYVPIPVPVPIPIPISAFHSWNPNDLLLHSGTGMLNVDQKQKQTAADIFHLWNNAAPTLLQQQIQEHQQLMYNVDALKSIPLQMKQESNQKLVCGDVFCNTAGSSSSIKQPTSSSVSTAEKSNNDISLIASTQSTSSKRQLLAGNKKLNTDENVVVLSQVNDHEQKQQQTLTSVTGKTGITGCTVSIQNEPVSTGKLSSSDININTGVSDTNVTVINNNLNVKFIPTTKDVSTNNKCEKKVEPFNDINIHSFKENSEKITKRCNISDIKKIVADDRSQKKGIDINNSNGTATTGAAVDLNDCAINKTIENKTILNSSNVVDFNSIKGLTKINTSKSRKTSTTATATTTTNKISTAITTTTNTNSVEKIDMRTTNESDTTINNAIITTKSAKMNTSGKIKSESDTSPTSSSCYLVSERMFTSSSDSESTSSDYDDNSEQKNKKSVQRCYDVLNSAQRNKILISENNREKSPTNSIKDKSMSPESIENQSSSESADSDDLINDSIMKSNRRKKSKKFSKVFVVNHTTNTTASSSAAEETDSQSSASDSNLEDSSSSDDSDVDTEGDDDNDDCKEIILNYMKFVPEKFDQDRSESKKDGDYDDGDDFDGNSYASLKANNNKTTKSGFECSVVENDDCGGVVLNSVKTLPFDKQNSDDGNDENKHAMRKNLYESDENNDDVLNDDIYGVSEKINEINEEITKDHCILVNRKSIETTNDIDTFTDKFDYQETNITDNYGCDNFQVLIECVQSSSDKIISVQDSENFDNLSCSSENEVVAVNKNETSKNKTENFYDVDNISISTDTDGDNSSNKCESNDFVMRKLEKDTKNTKVLKLEENTVENESENSSDSIENIKKMENNLTSTPKTASIPSAVSNNSNTTTEILDSNMNSELSSSNESENNNENKMCMNETEETESIVKDESITGSITASSTIESSESKSTVNVDDDTNNAVTENLLTHCFKNEKLTDNALITGIENLPDNIEDQRQNKKPTFSYNDNDYDDNDDEYTQELLSKNINEKEKNCKANKAEINDDSLHQNENSLKYDSNVKEIATNINKDLALNDDDCSMTNQSNEKDDFVKDIKTIETLNSEIITEVNKLNTISKDVNMMLEYEKQETDYLVEKLIKDVKIINENYLKKPSSSWEMQEKREINEEKEDNVSVEDNDQKRGEGRGIFEKSNLNKITTKTKNFPIRKSNKEYEDTDADICVGVNSKNDEKNSENSEENEIIETSIKNNEKRNYSNQKFSNITTHSYCRIPRKIETESSMETSFLPLYHQRISSLASQIENETNETNRNHEGSSIINKNSNNTNNWQQFKSRRDLVNDLLLIEENKIQQTFETDCTKNKSSKEQYEYTTISNKNNDDSSSGSSNSNDNDDEYDSSGDSINCIGSNSSSMNTKRQCSLRSNDIEQQKQNKSQQDSNQISPDVQTGVTCTGTIQKSLTSTTGRNKNNNKNNEECLSTSSSSTTICCINSNTNVCSKNLNKTNTGKNDMTIENYNYNSSNSTTTDSSYLSHKKIQSTTVEQNVLYGSDVEFFEQQISPTTSLSSSSSSSTLSLSPLLSNIGTKNFNNSAISNNNNSNELIANKYRSLIMITSQDLDNNLSDKNSSDTSQLSNFPKSDKNYYEQKNLNHTINSSNNNNNGSDNLVFIQHMNSNESKEICSDPNNLLGSFNKSNSSNISGSTSSSSLEKQGNKVNSNISLSQQYRKYLKNREDQKNVVGKSDDGNNAAIASTEIDSVIATINTDCSDVENLNRSMVCKSESRNDSSSNSSSSDSNSSSIDINENNTNISGITSDTNNDVTVITGVNTLSAVVCLEDGLADDDSWVEEISHDEDEFAGTTATESDVDSGEDTTSLSMLIDREEELRGYNRTAIDFTLHTIVEESCEESEVEQNDKKKHRISDSELEKYFFYGLGDGKAMSSINTKEESASEVSSVCSEGLDSFGISEEPNNDFNSDADLASSRLEKYFLSGFMGFSAERNESDESGSVGSDSEGHPSPSQRRKRLVRARGTPRSHSSSLDNLLAKDDSNEFGLVEMQNERLDSSESEACDETVIHVDKNESQNDTIKRKKQNRKRHDSDERKSSELSHELIEDGSEKAECRTPQQEYFQTNYSNLAQSKKQHSRDSGFIGSNDDLLKSDEINKTPELRIELEEIKEDSLEAKDTDQDQSASTSKQTPTLPSLIRKDSFNNWSSDEETNLMMSKMRQFFKTLVAASANAQINSNSRTSTPIVSGANTPRQSTPISHLKNKAKSAQLIYFESELTRLMKTVPGINDEQVREIVEYLSSEDTWSDSYDSSDYTSSDLEGVVNKTRKAELKEQISASCQQIINNFDYTVNDEEGDRGDGGLIDESHVLNPETAFVYQKLVASFSKMATGSNEECTNSVTPNKSPQLFAKVMHHIGTRLVALMHEVSSGDSHASNSPVPPQRQHKKLHQKISATTTEDDDSPSDSNLEKPINPAMGINSSNNLPRSKSHDLLLSDTRPPHHQSSSGVSDTACEEKEASDYERFSWRGSFESALLANGDSRTKLTLLDRDNSSSASALAAKRRSAGDLLFNQKSLSREQLDRVRSCGSIGGNTPEHDLESSKLWSSVTSQGSNRRRSSVPDAICESSDSSDDDSHNFPTRSTLPRSLQATSSASTNSLPRLSTANLLTTMQKSQSVHHFLPNSVKSARYRPPGFTTTNRPNSVPKKASSTSGLQQLLYAKRDARRKLNLINTEEANAAAAAAAANASSTDTAYNSPLIGNRNNAAGVSGSTSPIASRGSTSSDPWPSQSEEDIDRLVALHQNRNSLSSLGVRSDSMASVYSGAGEGRYGTVAVKGQVEFGMQYNYKQSALEIHVVRCKDLAAVDAKRNRSDPYVKVYLLPDKSKSGKRKTKVKKHTLNPVFDETLKFYMPLSCLESRTLWLTVWHSDMFGRNDFLGEVTINLQGKVFDNPQSQWYLLQERSEPYEDLSAYRGDIIVGLKFIPPDTLNSKQSIQRGNSTNLRKFGSIKSISSKSGGNSSSTSSTSSSKGQLHVLVKEAKNLSPAKATGSYDAFCKSYLLPDKTRSSKQKTHVVKRSNNPVWNYTFIYEDVSLQELSDRALELTVWDHDRLASNEFLGGVRFSLGTGKHNGKSVDWMDATGKELSLWQNMLNRPNFWVEGAVTLRSSLDDIFN